MASGIQDAPSSISIAMENSISSSPATSIPVRLLRTCPPPGSGQFCEYKGIPIACGPRGLKSGVNSLYRNLGDGIFADVSAAAGIRNTHGKYSLGVLTLDYDGDGWPDIYVACDSAPSILYRNKHDGTFEDLGIASGVSLNEDGEAQAGMGVAAADYKHQGRFAILKNKFLRRQPQPVQLQRQWLLFRSRLRSGSRPRSQLSRLGSFVPRL